VNIMDIAIMIIPRQVIGVEAIVKSSSGKY